jgi:alkylation response protein AidB-like acyl-CoA dehydrogenase
VPAENVLGEVGKGFQVAMAILNNGRPAWGGAVGGMKALISCQPVKPRTAAVRPPIAEFGLVREKIAQMTDVLCRRKRRVVVAHYIDSCAGTSVEAAISKVFASDAIQRAAWKPHKSQPAMASCANSLRTDHP